MDALLNCSNYRLKLRVELIDLLINAISPACIVDLLHTVYGNKHYFFYNNYLFVVLFKDVGNFSLIIPKWESIRRSSLEIRKLEVLKVLKIVMFNSYLNVIKQIAMRILLKNLTETCLAE